jgi:cyclase
MNGRVVKGVNFVDIKDVSDPVELALLYEKEGADELVFLDITATNENRKLMTDTLRAVTAAIKIPLCAGGGIAALEDIESVLAAGAAKVSVNSAAVKNPGFIKEAADKFGSERIIAAIDVKNTEKGYTVHTNGGKTDTGLDAVAWAVKVAELGAGGILLTSMDKDGTKDGYDIEITGLISEAVDIPVTASGGCGKLEHFFDVFEQTKAASALAASLFHYRELTVGEVKQFLTSKNIPVLLTKSKQKEKTNIPRLIALLLILSGSIFLCVYTWVLNPPQFNDIHHIQIDILTLPGAGTEADPYRIQTADELLNFAESVNFGMDFAGEYVLLENDISLYELMQENEQGWKPIGKNYIVPFRGVFDGGGHTVSDFWIYYDNDPHTGFFGFAENATIRNLNLVIAEGHSVKGKLTAGVLMGFQSGEASLVENCTAIGDVQVVENGGTDTYAGGLIGAASGTVKNSKASVSVTLWGGGEHSAYAGGLIGITRGDILNCQADGDVAIFAKDGFNGDELMLSGGGLTGAFIFGGRLEHSSASGSVTVKSEFYHQVSAGGLAGMLALDGRGARYCVASGDVAVSVAVLFDNDGTREAASNLGYYGNIIMAGGLFGSVHGGELTDSYATGNVHTDGGWTVFIGGLSGNLSNNSAVSRSYATGLVNARDAVEILDGGLTGGISMGCVIENSYYDMDTTGQEYTSSGCYYNELFDGTYPEMVRSTAEMQTRETFEGWDFDNVWIMPAGGGYPVLR